MNICFCNTNTSWGGGEKWHLEMASAISELPDFKVSFLLNKNSVLDQKIDSEKISKLYFNLKKFSFLSPSSFNQLKKLLKDQNFDVLIFNGPNELKLVARVAKACGIKKIIYRRGSDKAIKNSFINRFLLENVVTHLIANSEATKQSLLKTGIKIEDKIHIINNGIHPPLNLQKGATNKKAIIGALGRLETQKGFDLLLKSASVLKSNNIDFKLIIGGSGSQLGELQEEVAKLNLEDTVEFAGFIEDIYSFLNQCDVFALSSRYEGFGYVMVEAMFCKKPVVAYNISSAKEIVQDNTTGILVDSYNYQAFASALQQLIEDNQTAQLYGNAGQIRANEFFSFNKSITKFIKVLSQN
nr:glycosyltransferase [uncultured Carboxylicivirga sp.]